MRPALSLLAQVYLTVVIAVTIMVMMKVTINEIAGMIAVRNSLVPAIFTVNMACFVAFAGVIATTELVLIYMIAVLMMEMSIMQIVRMIAVLNRCMSAVSRMFVLMVAVCFAVTHRSLRSQISWSFILVIKTVFGFTLPAPHMRHNTHIYNAPN